MDLVPELSYTSVFGNAASLLGAGASFQSMTDNCIGGLSALISEGTVAPEDMSRNRIYPLGAAQGYVLDLLGVDWKPEAQLAGNEFAFFDLIRTALALEDSLVASNVAAAKESYDYDKIFRQSEISIAAYCAGFDSALTVFASQPDTRVELRFSGRNMLRSRHSSSKKWIRDNGSRELRGHNNVYTLKGLSGEKFWFQLKDAGLLELTDWDTRDKELVFYCTNIDSLVVDGTPQIPTGEATLQFYTLFVRGPRFELITHRKGTVFVSDSCIAVDVAP